MMASPAQRHLARAAARQRAGAVMAASALARADEGPEATAYLLERARLGVDLRRLHDIASGDRRNALKAELLPAYVPWIEGVLQGEADGAKGVQDDVLVRIMIWRVDVGDWAGAIPLARYVLRWGLTLPDRFNRKPATFIAEDTAEAALNAIGQDQDFPIEVLDEVGELTADEDMNDIVRAKLMKATGLQLARSAATIELDADGPAGAKRATLERALRFLNRATELNSSAGVKKQCQALAREIGKLAEPSSEGEKP